ncbi:13500_t:CDS:1, partial [Cetraspora pellucida]
QQQEVIDELKNRLTSAPILTHPQDNVGFVLYTDASHFAFCAILSQSDNNGLKDVVEYASRSTKPVEQKYIIIELECTTIVWAVKKFHQYLYRFQFTIVTDHMALTYLNNMANLTSRM